MIPKQDSKSLTQWQWKQRIGYRSKRDSRGRIIGIGGPLAMQELRLQKYPKAIPNILEISSTQIRSKNRDKRGWAWKKAYRDEVPDILRNFEGQILVRNWKYATGSQDKDQEMAKISRANWQLIHRCAQDQIRTRIVCNVIKELGVLQSKAFKTMLLIATGRRRDSENDKQVRLQPTILSRADQHFLGYK